jgi:hypothetical protein
MNNKSLVLIAILLIAITVLVGCEPQQDNLSQNMKKNSEVVAVNQNKLEQQQPAPQINFSNERANLIKRATTFNDPNKVSYIYLISDSGTVMAFYTVKGKVSNVSSYLVPDEQIVKDPYAYQSQGLVLQAPDIDGSYGSNGSGVFFYTTDNVYVEWNGKYMLCDQPLKLATQPVLVQEVKR